MLDKDLELTSKARIQLPVVKQAKLKRTNYPAGKCQDKQRQCRRFSSSIHYEQEYYISGCLS